MGTKIKSTTSACGYPIHLYDDGHITGPLRHHIPGMPTKPQPLDIAFRFMDDAALYDKAELPALIKAAQKHTNPAAMRKYAEHINTPIPVRIQWTTTATDRNGKPIEKLGTLPRLRWPQYAIIYTPNSKKRYQVYNKHQDILRPTGIHFPNRRALYHFLHQT